MEKKMVVIYDDGELTTGVVEGFAEVGEVVTVELHDENGMPIKKTGEVFEVLYEIN